MRKKSISSLNKEKELSHHIQKIEISADTKFHLILPNFQSSKEQILLNAEKTEPVVFQSPWKVLPDKIKIKISGKSLHLSNSVKSLVVRNNRFLNWRDQVNSIAAKFNRANTLLLKIRNCVIMKTFRNILQYLTLI